MKKKLELFLQIHYFVNPYKKIGLTQPPREKAKMGVSEGWNPKGGRKWKGRCLSISDLRECGIRGKKESPGTGVDLGSR